MTSIILKEEFIIERVTIFRDILREDFFEKIIEVSTINFNNELIDLR